MTIDDRTEWLEADGLGGFASGTVSGIRTRRYHALLLTATTPPTGRVVLVNGFDAFVDTPAGSFALTTQRYAPGVLHPDGSSRIATFDADPWPTWTFDAPDGTRVRQEIFVQRGTGAVFLSWHLERGASATLRLRPLLSGRDYHSTHHENGAFRFDAERDGSLLRIRPYDGLPAATLLSNGTYRSAPDWYRQFLYSAEQERGLDALEDLASPGELSWSLSPSGNEAVLMLSADGAGLAGERTAAGALKLARDTRDAERRRRVRLTHRGERAAESYIVRRGAGLTIVAGYPWFTDWGRDTFIAVRGLCLATGRHEEARDILVAWADEVSEGMLPNRFPDRGEAPEFNSVDASLWYIVAAHELLDIADHTPSLVSAQDRRRVEAAVLSIVGGYARGTRFGIRMDSDGLLAAGSPGVQLTWMDAKFGDHVVTPRMGKPVEVQALWLNALAIAARLDAAWRDAHERGRRTFEDRFWSEPLGRLADVVDVDHVPGTRDDTFRPNQILAVGGLPEPLVSGPRARRIVDAVEATLLTPLGLRSLSPDDPSYVPRYEGGPVARDAAYHQGTVWPWLIGPFVEAWVRVRGSSDEARREARQRFLEPLWAHLSEAGLGHVSEIADADPPFAPKGCPFQAWSLGELLRLDNLVLAHPAPAAPRRRTKQMARG